MHSNHCLGTLLACTMLFASGMAAAQDDVRANDQAAVWAAVEGVWAAAEDGDSTWIENMLSADFVGWPKSSPAPRSKGSIRMWNRFEQEQFEGVAHELYPLSIVVHGDMAVVHYLYTNAVRSKDKATQVRNGRYTDILVRDEGSWKFISWHGGDDD
ncbi:MAG: nuclear transport factor 2 family protein [Woeseiaceae bacterium]|nr:nuclear transport factor 2 family protein [Woeseiaceae bacterium]